MWERLSSRDQKITVLERRLFVAGKPLPREILAKLMTLGPTPALERPYNPFARHILWNLQDAIKNASVNRTSISKLSQTGKNAERPKAERIKALA